MRLRCHRCRAVPKIVPSPKKFSDNPLYDVRNPLNRAPILAAPRLKRLCSEEVLPTRSLGSRYSVSTFIEPSAPPVTQRPKPIVFTTTFALPIETNGRIRPLLDPKNLNPHGFQQFRDRN